MILMLDSQQTLYLKGWNKPMKKLAVLLSILILSLSLFACGQAPESSPAKDGKDGKIKIEYYHVNAETQGGISVKELVDNFNKNNDHIEVVATYNPDMYKGLMQNLQAKQAAKESPAIAQIGWAFLDYFSNNFDYVSPQEAIDEFDKEDPDFLKENFLPNILDLAKNSKGDQVGIPYSLSTPVLYINRDILKECGLPEAGPQTWQEVSQFAKTIKEKTGKYGLYIQEPQDFWAQQALVESNGGKMIQDHKASFADPQGIEAMELYQTMVQDGSAIHISWDEGVQSFVDGNIAMCYTTIARREQIQKGAQFDVAAVKSPTFAGKDRCVPAGGCFLAITATDKDQIKAAWEFEKYLYGVEQMATWTKGTGYTPPRKGVAEAENGLKAFLEENQMMKPAIEQSKDVVSWASFPGNAGLQAEQLLLDMRDEILAGANVQESMTTTQEKINSLLEK